jgi:hypothetical protein
MSPVLALHGGTGSLISCPVLGAVSEADGGGGLARRDTNDPTETCAAHDFCVAN